MKSDQPKKATLIKLEDQRQILCGPEVANLMLEFGRIFNAQICRIKFTQPQDIKLMGLKETVSFICEGKNTTIIPEHKVVTILVQSEELPKELKNAVASQLADKKIVKVKSLASQFPKINEKNIKNYLKSLGEKIKSDGLMKVELEDEYLKVS